jgi:hypothetical protein
LFDLNIRVAENHFRQFPKRFQFPAGYVCCILLFKPVDVHGAIVLLKKNDRPRTSGLSFPCPSDTLLDHPSTKIGVDQTIIRPLCCLPEIGVGNTSFPGEADERLAFVDRQRSGGCRFLPYRLALSVIDCVRLIPSARLAALLLLQWTIQE